MKNNLLKLILVAVLLISVTTTCNKKEEHVTYSVKIFTTFAKI